jgi:hypothetical protein
MFSHFSTEIWTQNTIFLEKLWKFTFSIKIGKIDKIWNLTINLNFCPFCKSNMAKNCKIATINTIFLYSSTLISAQNTIFLKNYKKLQKSKFSP